MATKKKAAKKAAPKKKQSVPKKAAPPKGRKSQREPIKVTLDGVITIRLENTGGTFANYSTAAAAGGTAGGANPYEFVIKIKKLTGLTVQRIDIQAGTIYDDDLTPDPTDATVDVGETSSAVPGGTFILTIMAVGDAFTATTFSLTCDGKKVFDEDQEIKITSSGRGGYRNIAVPLP
jgi:hypothetical protein